MLSQKVYVSVCHLGQIYEEHSLYILEYGKNLAEIKFYRAG